VPTTVERFVYLEDGRTQRNGLTSFPWICLFHAANKIQNVHFVLGRPTKKRSHFVLTASLHFCREKILWTKSVGGRSFHASSEKNCPISYLLADFHVKTTDYRHLSSRVAARGRNTFEKKSAHSMHRLLLVGCPIKAYLGYLLFQKNPITSSISRSLPPYRALWRKTEKFKILKNSIKNSGGMLSSFFVWQKRLS